MDFTDFTATLKEKSHIEPLGIDDNDAQNNTCLVPTNISSANYSMTFTESRFCVGAYSAFTNWNIAGRQYE